MVQLLRLDIDGFGKFDRHKTINFENGINFITGLNEAGKSTVLEAIMASIFKYTRGQIEPFLCWKNNDVCKTALTYKTQKGEIFRITSDYKSGRRRLDRVKKGSPEEIATLDKAIEPFIKRHFGFDDKKVFENTAFIRQSQMAILQDNSVRNKIKDMIEEVFTGRAEASATKALAKIRKIAKDTTKEIEVLEDEQRELKENLRSAEEKREVVAKDSGEFEKIDRQLSEKSKELEKQHKNKKLFDEKEKLLKEKEHLDEQIVKVDELLETLSEDKEPHREQPSNKKTTSIILIVIGGLLSITGIGAIIGIPLIIWGIIKLRKKEVTVEPIKKDSEKISKYSKEKKELLNRKAVIETRLEQYNLVNFNIDDFDELEVLKKDVDSLRDKKTELKTSIKTTTSFVESPEDVREKLNANKEKHLSLIMKIEEHELAAKFLELAESEVHHKLTPAIEKNSKPILKKITNERYSDLKIAEDTLDIRIKAPEIKEYVDVYFLSQGARDQLYFALRVIMSDLLGGEANIPLILDDPFHNFDDPRLRNTIDTLKQIAKNKQIILISHRPYHHEFKTVCDNVVEL
jgi:DNA repair exonuclease SbcCD ATPase subunit